MAIKQETELYAPLKSFFERQGYDIKGEVRTCDLVGIREDESQPLIVEMKKSFNLALLLQGVERLRLSPNVYLAVERVRDKKGAVNQRWGELSGLCRRLGLGLITVVFYKTKAPLVEVLAEPGDAPPQARSAVRRRERLLYEFRERSGDYNTGGSTRVKLVTAYREKALRVALALQALEAEAAAAAGLAGAKRAGLRGAPGPGDAADPAALEAAPSAADALTDAAGGGAGEARPAGTARGVTPAALRKRSGVPGAAAILQKNYYAWFFRVGRGRYSLTAAGTAALIEYAAIAEISAGKQ
ncbi:DUF2161 family putative PD-(D/E)XK-type phosphodiesterase [Paenibacillus sp. MMS20-IR301]|uniref:DUF2161 family putative PD-(D/E)XK-type phosphodiesterase n=1 Tax=Paenibacillus sp. MMS20-IR301 TaxID=2895946 RepID=UPI0028E49612|nr:DUF2161 family putative PD-(D/E)XK-type phosphodiesterase [Paenibacillus sp. MMS20-IR301]WNS46515.1 DUF2161 family putative PD-(D/E)XK-type phosphodiesterase [Paenibacillus sp. MMS20-IR301]